ncbi:MAG: formate dehydrogenase [Burkholderiales bacterium]
MSHKPQRAAPAQSVSSASPSSRRRFLLALGAGSAGAATVAVAQPLAGALPQEAPAPEAGKGYQETDHVRDYYATARL